MTFKKSLALSLASAFAGAALLASVTPGPSTTPETQFVTPVSVSTSTTKPAPSKYCKKADLNKVVNYRTPSGSASYKIKCTTKTTQAWKKVS